MNQKINSKAWPMIIKKVLGLGNRNLPNAKPLQREKRFDEYNKIKYIIKISRKSRK